MKDLCEQLIELLGKRRPESAESLIKLIQDLGEKPVEDCTHERLWFYEFRESGFGLVFDSKEGVFKQLTLYIATPAVGAGEIQAYAGKLPFGIERTDSEEDVEKKLPGGTKEVKDYRYDVDLRPLVLRFHFQAPDFDHPGLGERRLSMVSATYD